MIHLYSICRALPVPMKSIAFCLPLWLIGTLLAQTVSPVILAHQQTGRPSSTTQNPPIQKLEINNRLDRQMRGGESHLYQLSLAAGQYARVSLEHKNLDVSILIFAPDGKRLAESNYPNPSNSGLETTAVIAEVSGDYQIKVQAHAGQPHAGLYILQLEEPRLPTPQDHLRLDAQRAVMEATDSFKDQSAEAGRRAITKYSEAARLFGVAEDFRMQFHTLKTVGMIAELQAEPQKALDVYTQALSLVSYLDNAQEPAATYFDIARVHRGLYNYAKAIEYFELALPLFRTNANRKKEGETLVALGNSSNDLGEKQKAFDYFNEALALSQADNNAAGQLLALTHIGGIYLTMDLPQSALDYYRQALVIAENLKRRMDPAILLNNMGKAYSDLGDHQQALEAINQSLKMRRELGDVTGEGLSLSNMGRTYFLLGEYAKALEHSNQALLLYEQANYRIGKSVVFSNLGRCYQVLGDKEKAADFYHQALQLNRSIEDKKSESVILYNLAKLESERNNRQQAINHIAAAIEIIESLRTKITIQELRASYLASSQSFYELYIDLLMQAGSTEQVAFALHLAERARARTLLDSLRETGIDIRQGVDPRTLKRERELKTALNSKSNALMRLLALNQSGESAAQVKQEIDTLKTQLQQVEAMIRQASPRYAALTQPQPLTLPEIQKQVVDENSILLEYSLGENRSYLWAITPTAVTSYNLGKRADIESVARRYYELLTSRNRFVRFETAAEKRVRVAQEDIEMTEIANTLSQMILAPVAALLGAKRILIVSDSALQYIPFASLPVGKQSATQNTFLGAANEIVNLPSASTLAVLRRENKNRAVASKSIAIFADPVFNKNDARFTLAKSQQAKNQSLVARTRNSAHTRNAQAIEGRKETTGNSPSTQQTAALPPTQTVKTGATKKARFREHDLTRAATEVGFADDAANSEGFTLPRLPFTRREASAIASLTTPAQRIEAVDFDANKEAVLTQDFSRYRYIHFATHGFLNTTHPELSGIVLSMVDEDGNPEDGFLRAHEIYNLKLPAELVVLSGCRTGLGKEIRGEGLIGLTRGFMYAGAARVLVSLWDVSDEATAEFMSRFYQAMLGKEQVTAAAALRAAQVLMAKDKRWGAPYYWAAFVLQGEPL
jgi:CHAT domain-containing protein/tetratricopeptide (TPR) repeat protein